jgi:hypothetical protein
MRKKQVTENLNDLDPISGLFMSAEEKLTLPDAPAENKFGEPRIRVHQSF